MALKVTKTIWAVICLPCAWPLILYLSVIIFCCSTQQKMKIVIGNPDGELLSCPDTLVVKGINLSIKKGDKYDGLIGCMDGIGYSKIFTGIDTLYFECTPIKWLYLKEGESFYETTVDTASLQRLNDTLMAFKHACIKQLF
ncbi:MAG: hypothetical protein LBH25_05465 [Fibromonadaceae bacterium]|jgi:hypothetical protein|nr:hypothetical protein [Fibromonadaceae bacterium]